MNLFTKNLGFTLIEFMVAIALSSIVALGMMSLHITMNKSTISANNSAQADIFRKQITGMLSDLNAWRNTIYNTSNTSFACIQNGTDCSGSASNGPGTKGSASAASVTGIFDVYDPKGNAYYTPKTDGNRGFNISGQQCGTTLQNGVTTAGATGFSLTTPNNNCPYRLVLWWVPICPNTVSSCINPLIHVLGYTLYSPVTTVGGKTVFIPPPFNPYAYGVNLVLTPTP
jgi:prepilin-type N-terminal cleavage/methylation domain-containing protein